MRALVDDVLKCLGCYSKEASNLVCGTIAQESQYGRYRRQIGGGPALGIAQMESATFNDIINNFLVYHRDIGNRVLNCAGVSEFNPADLIENDRLAIAMCRMQYYRRPVRLPYRIPDLAAMWKKYYNTPLGAGTVEEFLSNYERYVIPDTPAV